MQTIYEYVRKHNGDRGYAPIPALIATQCNPGSIEKIQVMRQRACCGEGIFHQDDARIEAAPLNEKFFNRDACVSMRNFSRENVRFRLD